MTLIFPFMATYVKQFEALELFLAEKLKRDRYIKQMKTSLLAVLFFISSCVDPANVADKSKVVAAMATNLQKRFDKVNHITSKEAQNIPEAELIYVDVRSQVERQVSMIKGAISFSEFQKLPKEKLKSKHIIFYCTIGQRSSEKVQELKKSGYQGKISNLQGSILAWTHANLPLVDSSGSPTKRVHVYSEAWNLVPKNYEAVWK